MQIPHVEITTVYFMPLEYGPLRFLSPDFVEFVFGVNDFGVGTFVCLEPVTNFDTGSDFALAILFPLVRGYGYSIWS